MIWATAGRKNAKADVNVLDVRCWAPVDWVGHWINLAVIQEHEEVAGDTIVWNARTPDGKTALHLGEEHPRIEWIKVMYPAYVDGLFGIFRGHIVDKDSVESEVDVLVGMPGSFSYVEGRTVRLSCL